MSISNLIRTLPTRDRSKLADRLVNTSSIRGVTSSSASILGKNYLKQVDVIMTDWATGPELLISTKRMDSSFGKNAPNRIEESYGDAKNLRLRHPIAALGFLFGLRSTILQEEPDTAAWLLDQIEKLGREDDAYHATCVVLIVDSQGSLRQVPLSHFHHFLSEGFGWGSPSEALSGCPVQAVANRLHISI